MTEKIELPPHDTDVEKTFRESVQEELAYIDRRVQVLMKHVELREKMWNKHSRLDLDAQSEDESLPPGNVPISKENVVCQVAKALLIKAKVELTRHLAVAEIYSGTTPNLGKPLLYDWKDFPVATNEEWLDFMEHQHDFPYSLWTRY